MSGEVRFCPTCGAKTVEYKHSLTVPLARGLVKLARAGGGPARLTEIDLGRHEWTNFQKLRYWGLAEASFRDGERLRGAWELTELGRSFLAGECTVRRIAVTYRNATVRFEGPDIHAREVEGLYQQSEQWAAEARPVDPQNPPEHLF